MNQSLVLAGVFLVFLIFYQANPDSYVQTVENTLDSVYTTYKENKSTTNDLEETEYSPLISKVMDHFLLGIVSMTIAFVYLTSIIAMVIPFDAITLLYIWAVLMVLSIIPWGVLLGLGLFIKDWLDKRKSTNSIETDKEVKQ